MNKYRVTFTRRVLESVTLNVEARTRQDAVMAAAMCTIPEEDWERDIEDSRVGKIDRAAEPKGDPPDVPPLLKRSA